MKNIILEGLSVKLAYKATKNPEMFIVCAENGLSLRLKQNNHIENIVGTFLIAKYVDNEIVSLNKNEKVKQSMNL